MKKRILSVLLLLAMLLGCVPGGVGAETEQYAEPSQAAYDRADAIFEEIDRLESVRATRNTNQSRITDAVEALVMETDTYVEGSLRRNGDAFSWMTTDGIRCAYSPRMREINKNMTPTENGGEDLVYNEPVATRGGFPAGNQVYLIGPYYGYDADFTNQYKNEATRIAATIGDTDGYTLYSGKSATVDKVAEAVSKGAVVIFDSHGSTDYESGNDRVSGATSSYLCLSSTSGLTGADYADGALYHSSGIFINGATIANHMKSDSPGGILWMAICLGMATNTICNPLREKGVEVVYGYSQSVTFAGDYLFEKAFWDKMCEGKTVAEAASYMKSTWGNWDMSTQIAKHYGYSGYSTITSARSNYAAFPVIVADENSHPGQRNRNLFYGADSMQTVKSTYTIFQEECLHPTVENGICADCQAAFAARTADGYWNTVQDAVEKGSGVVQLLQDAKETVTTQTLLLDLNGHTLQKLTVTKALYGYDSSATAAAEGTGSILALQGPVAPEYTVDGVRYIALSANGGYTFHVLELSMETLSLRTDVAGLYYRGALACDSTLRRIIDRHGVALSTVDMPGADYNEAHNLFTEKTGAPEGEFASVMVSGIFKAAAADNEQRGKMVVYANAYLVLEDGSVLLSDNTNTDSRKNVGFDGVAYSLYDMMTAVDLVAPTLPAAQQTALESFCNTWNAPMADWQLKNLIG